MNYRIALTCLGLPALTGCVPVYTYKPDPDNLPATIVRRVDEKSKHLGISFAIDDDGKCPLLGYVKGDIEQDVNVPSGKRIWIQFGYNTGAAWCFSKLSFIPKPNERYYADYKVIPYGCTLNFGRLTEDGKREPEESVIGERYQMCMF